MPRGRVTLWIVLGTIGLVGVAAIWLVPSAVSRFAVSKASERGVELQIKDVELGFREISLLGVAAKHRKLDAVNTYVDRVRVGISLSGPRYIRAESGSVIVKGARTQVLQQFHNLRSPEKYESDSSAGYSSKQLPLSLKSFSVDWKVSADEHYFARGINLEKTLSGASSTIEEVRGFHPAGSVALAELQLRLELASLQLQEVRSESTVLRIRPGVFLKTSDESEDGSGESALEAPGASIGAGAPKAAAAKDKEEAAKLGLLARLPLDVERGPRLRQRLHKLAGQIARRLPEGGSIELRGVRVALEGANPKNDKSQLNLGPALFAATRVGDSVRLSFVPGKSPKKEEERGVGQLVTVAVTLPLAEGPVVLRVQGGPVPLSELGVQKGNIGIDNPKSAPLKIDTELTLSADGTEGNLEVSGAISNLSIAHPKLAPTPLEGITIGFDGAGNLRLDGSLITIKDGNLRVGEVRLTGQLSAQREQERLVFSAKGKVPSVHCQAAFDSIPSAMVPLLAGLRLKGQFSWAGALAFDTDDLTDMTARFRMKNRCRMMRIPPAVNPSRFRRPFKRAVPGVEDGEMLEDWTGPNDKNWTALYDVSRHLETAVLVTEDGGFWDHNGFNERAIESSIRQNLSKGRFFRGASTISMQLAKNLYLSRDKHLSRKLQEAVLTVLLEQEMRKDEILELYFNVIEFAPRVYGIKKAAKHYFDSAPADLSVAQSFFLASILPNPKQHHFTPSGNLGPRRAAYLRLLLKRAHQRKLISRQELQAGLAENLKLGVSHEGGPEALVDPYSEDGPEEY